MKNQKYNEGELKELKVDIVEAYELMSNNTNISIPDLVVIALRRFKSSHGDYLGTSPELK